MPGSPRSRRRRALLPTCQALESRELLSGTTPMDPPTHRPPAVLDARTSARAHKFHGSVVGQLPAQPDAIGFDGTRQWRRQSLWRRRCSRRVPCRRFTAAGRYAGFQLQRLQQLARYRLDDRQYRAQRQPVGLLPGANRSRPGDGARGLEAWVRDRGQRPGDLRQQWQRAVGGAGIAHHLEPFGPPGRRPDQPQPDRRAVGHGRQRSGKYSAIVRLQCRERDGDAHRFEGAQERKQDRRQGHGSDCFGLHSAA